MDDIIFKTELSDVRGGDIVRIIFPHDTERAYRLFIIEQIATGLPQNVILLDAEIDVFDSMDKLPEPMVRRLYEILKERFEHGEDGMDGVSPTSSETCECEKQLPTCECGDDISFSA